MKNIIKYNGKLYQPLEEGGHTIQAEIVEVVKSVKGETMKTPEEIAKTIISQIFGRDLPMPSECEEIVADAIRAERSQPDEREHCCNCEYHLTKKANERADKLESTLKEKDAEIERLWDGQDYIRADMQEEINSLTSQLQAQAEALQEARNICLRVCSENVPLFSSDRLKNLHKKCADFLELPLPDSARKWELMDKVVEAAKDPGCSCEVESDSGPIEDHSKLCMYSRLKPKLDALASLERDKLQGGRE